ncbi:hypothetical protein Tco_0324973 [Tanacetum coccineum]
MGTVSDVITGGTEGAIQQGPVRARVLNDLSAEEKERYKADIRATNILLQGIPKDIYSLINHYTDAKAVGKGLKESNCDQLYAYLKQHEVHANENRIMMERFCQPNNDPLALVSDASVQQKFFTETPPPLVIECFSNSLPSSSIVQITSSSNNNQLRASSNARNKAMVQDGKVVVQDAKATSRFQPTSKDKMLLMQAQESGAVLDEEQSLFLAGEQVTNVDDNVDDSPENDLALNVDHVFEADECDAFDSDVDEGVIMKIYGNKKIMLFKGCISVRNDALMSILDEMHEQGVRLWITQIPCTTNMVVNDSVFSDLPPAAPPLSNTLLELNNPLKEVKNMKEIFDQMNNEVDKNTVDKQCAEIEKKNLLIENENLIVNCLSTQLLYDVEKSVI